MSPVTTAENSSKKKRKSAPPATENTPTEQEVTYSEPEVTAEPPTSPFPRDQIEKAFSNPMLKGFKKYLDPLLTYFETVEARLQATDANFKIIGETFDKLQPLIQLSQQVAQRQAQAQTPGATAPGQPTTDAMAVYGPLAAQLIPQLLGSASNPITDELTKKIVDAGLEQMTMGTTLLKAVEKKILTDMGAKVATEAMPK